MADLKSNTGKTRVMTQADVKLGRRTDALFKALSTDYLLREQFITDPAQIMSEYLFGKSLAEETSDSVNQLLYSVMSNPHLRNWMVEYSMQLNGTVPTRQDFALQFAKAVAVSGDDLTR